MPEKKEIETLVIETVRQLAADFDYPALREPSTATALYGDGGPLDSMDLVNLIADLEGAVAMHFGVTISLTDEKAMSAKNSPYRSIASMADAIEERIAG